MNTKVNLVILIFSLFLLSCRNKTVQLLSKKWDCIQVENLVPTGTRFQNPQDSLNAIQLQNLLQSLSWTFYSNQRYVCTLGSRVTVQGTYALQENDKVLILTSESKNNANRYSINLLSENKLILSGSAENNSLVMRFSASR